jgi:uncharacterized protein YdiU (UPF0061 family)
MPPGPTYRPDPAYLALGDGFADVVTPARFPRHVLRHRDDRWAARIGLAELTPDEWEAHLARFAPLPDNLPAPLALRYHGHQFMTYNPHLGDGRGFLFAQVRDADDGRLLDLGTKGSGQTPWSRGGDGRLTLKGGVREILAAEMLEALGVYTSKALSLFETGEALERGDEPSPTRSSVLVRLSHSHVRFGTFQRLAFERDAARMQRLLAWTIEHYLAGADDADPAIAVLRAAVRRSARLCAAWTAAGFVHGVLNTDNMTITGESFDYGPWRFLPVFDPDFTAAYFDHGGLYAFGRQPQQVHWNLMRFAEALTLVSPVAPLVSVLELYPADHAEALAERMLWRLGLRTRGTDDDEALVEAVFAFLHESRIGFERFFFDWWGGPASAARAAASPVAAAYGTPAFAPLRRRLDAYEPDRPERLALPYFQRAEPCTMLIDEVEALWGRIAETDDWSALAAKRARIAELREALGGERLSATAPGAA